MASIRYMRLAFRPRLLAASVIVKRISRSKYYENWRDPMEWIHNYLSVMTSAAERDFKENIKSP